MAAKFNLHYLYITDESSEKIQRILDLTGSTEKAFISQVINEYFIREKIYYVEALRLDARARSIREQEYLKILIEQDEKALPRYTSDRPIFKPSPIAMLPDVEGNRRITNYILLNRRNTCLLKIASIVERARMSQLVGRLMVDHLRQNWDTVYLPQFKFEIDLIFD